MATDSSEQLRQAAIEHKELVRITSAYLYQKFGPTSTHKKCEVVARGLIAELAHNNYICEKVKE